MVPTTEITPTRGGAGERLGGPLGTPTSRIRLQRSDMPETIDICPVTDLPPGAMRTVEWEDVEIMVVNCDGDLFAVEDRCSHDDGPLAEGEIDGTACTVECPRHGALFDLRSGKPKTLPAYVPIETFPVLIEDDVIKLEVD